MDHDPHGLINPVGGAQRKRKLNIVNINSQISIGEYCAVSHFHTDFLEKRR